MAIAVFWIGFVIGSSMSIPIEATFHKHHLRTDTPSPNSFLGEATFKKPGLGTCGWISQEDQLVAAINHHQFGNPKRGRDGFWCGKCVEITASDFGTTVIVEVVDRFEGKEGHLVLSETAFNRLAAIEEEKINIQWKQILCARNLTGRSIKTSDSDSDSGRSVSVLPDLEPSEII